MPRGRRRSADTGRPGRDRRGRRHWSAAPTPSPRRPRCGLRASRRTWLRPRSPRRHCARKAVAKLGPTPAASISPGPAWNRRPGRSWPRGGRRGWPHPASAGWPTWAAASAPTRSPSPAPGLTVLAVEADPVDGSDRRSQCGRHCGLASAVEVRCADATTVDLSDVDAVFCDPARRDTGRGRRLFDPSAYSPPWSFVVGLAERVPATVLKLAPGIDHALIPPGAEARVGQRRRRRWWRPRCGTVRWRRRPAGRRCCGATTRRCSVAGATCWHRSGRGRRYLYDPDGAVVRAHLVAEFAATVDGTLVDPRIAYVFTDEPSRNPVRDRASRSWRNCRTE